MTNPTMGITEWINEIRHTPIYAILIGFAFGSTVDLFQSQIFPCRQNSDCSGI
ncbi:hypothetical protein ACE3MQ_24665 [Paenibacillus lentus]